MRITADTNVLVRAVMMDDPAQSAVAAQLLRESETVTVTAVSLCEFVWVLKAAYKQDNAAVASAIRRLLNAAKVRADRPAAEAGLAMLEAGGDFADGVIAHSGATDGGQIFASFDRKATKLLRQRGHDVLDLNEAP